MHVFWALLSEKNATEIIGWFAINFQDCSKEIDLACIPIPVLKRHSWVCTEYLHDFTDFILVPPFNSLFIVKQRWLPGRRQRLHSRRIPAKWMLLPGKGRNKGAVKDRGRKESSSIWTMNVHAGMSEKFNFKLAWLASFHRTQLLWETTLSPCLLYALYGTHFSFFWSTLLMSPGSVALYTGTALR